MKSLLYPIEIDESSARVHQLHLALAALGMQVAELERIENKAGHSTVRIIRELQARFGIQPDPAVVLNAITAAAIEKELVERGIVDQADVFTASGKVVDRSGKLAGTTSLLAYDVDLKGAAVYRKIKTTDEIKRNGGFEPLSEIVTDTVGNFSFTFHRDQFKNAERKKADIVVYAVNKNEVIGRSRLVNTEDYSAQGEVRGLNVLIYQIDNRTEYEKLMIPLTRFLEESKVALIDLANSSEQKSFCASELDVEVNNVSIATDATKLNADNKLQLSHELLYGLGRQGYQLRLSDFYKKKEAELTDAINKSIAQNIIQSYKAEAISAFIKQLLAAAMVSYLGKKNASTNTSLSEILSLSLPDSKQQVAFIDAVRSFDGSDYKDFWSKELPSRPEFKGKPELIKGILFTHQLTLITGNHQPLVAELQKRNPQYNAADLLSMTDNDWESILKKTGVPDGITGATDTEKQRNYKQQMQDVLNATYPTQKISLMLRNKEIIVDEKIAGSIQNFISKNPAFDFSNSKIHEFEKEINAAGNGNSAQLKSELLKMQRVFQVSATPQAMSVLMKNDLHSARSVANIPLKSFTKTYGDQLGGTEIAYAIHEKASYLTARSEITAMKMMEVSHSVVPKYAMDDSDYDAAMVTLKNEVPNYSELFGSPDICECDECRSVYGAAAYFVDLLRFLWRGVKNHDNKSPLDMLSQRRPDLLFLPLTCENTDTIIPYVDLVNEVMEFYTVNGSLASFEGYDTGDITAEELRADPQNFNIEAYRKLKDAKYPFTLPYHQPLNVIRTYGEHLKTMRQDAMEAMQIDFSQASQRAIEAESLGLCQEEYTILAKEDFAGTADVTPIHQYFGYTAHAQLESMAEVREFLKRSGVEYTDLVDLVTTTFINPHQNVIDFLEEIFVDSVLNASEIYDRLKRIDNGTLLPSADADVMVSLSAASITSEEFVVWVQNNFDGFNEAITLYEPNSLCQLDTTCLRTVGNIYNGVNSSGITDDIWSKIHRFIRLWKNLGWSIHDTDLLLAAIGGNDITTTTISRLSSALELSGKLKKPLNQLATIWGDIDTYGTKSLYKKLFLNKTVLNLDAAFDADNLGNYLSDTTQLLKDHIPAILAAFRMSQEDLDVILSMATVIDAISGTPRLLDLNTDVLNLPNVSTIYRYVVLAKALKYKVPDFCLLITLFSASPFSTWNNQAQVFDNISPADTLDFYEVAASIKKNNFKAAVLQYIFTGELPADSTLGLGTDKILAAAQTIRNTFLTIEQDHPTDPPLPLTTDILRSKLSLTFDADTVNELIGIIDGTVSFSTVTTNNLNLVIPDGIASRYSYINGSGRFNETGVMTDADKAALKALNVDVAYSAAIDLLYKLPEDFLNENFGGVFASNMTTAFTTLLDHPAQITPATLDDKLKFVYDNYVPILKQKLREDAIAQHIAALTGLTEDAAKVLTKSDVDALITDLATEGHSAEYFSDTTFTTLAKERIDDEINFNWDIGSPDPAVPADNFSARWQSYITPPATGDYTLTVTVNEADEAFRLYIDEVLVLEKVAANTLLSWEIIVPLNASQMRKIKLEYQETSGSAGIQLTWKTATTATSVVPSSSSYPASVIDAFIQTATIYHRAAKFITGFKLDEKELDHFITFNADFDNIDFKALTPTHWERISDYVSLRNAVPQAQASLVDVFNLANTTNPVPTVPDLTELLEEATAWDNVSLDYLVNTHFTLVVNDFKNEKLLSRVYDAIKIVSSTGISAETIAEWGLPETDFDALNETAQLIKSTVKAKYEEEDWLDVAGKLSDKIRENQKQGLISYLLMRPELQDWGVIDADSLFEYFLIDVQMGCCMDTSRIVQANAAVQMFVNRCFLNLESEKSTGNEKGVSPDALDGDRWEWMENYRVWEANRQVFLYPENWLEPEWRTDRSAFFKDLESELVQNDITDSSVETAFRNYLTSLNEVAHLEICGMCQENDDDGNLYLLHVFARKNTSPYTVFYRTWDQYMKWSAWEKVGVDVRNNEDGVYTGVHLAPVVWKKRLFLFWVEFSEKQEDSSATSGQTAKDASENDTLDDIKPRKYWEVRLAWTEYVDSKWTPKQLAKEYTKQYSGSVVKNPSYIRLLTEVQSDNSLLITTNVPFDGGWSQLSTFSLADITSALESATSTAAYAESWLGYGFFYMSLSKTDKLNLLDDDYLKASVNHKLLVDPTRFVNNSPTLEDPFFYSGKHRSYFVRPVNIRVIDKIRKPEVNVPFIPHIVDDSWYTQPHIPHVGPDDLMPGITVTDPVESILADLGFGSGVIPRAGMQTSVMGLSNGFNGIGSTIGSGGFNTEVPVATREVEMVGAAQPIVAAKLAVNSSSIGSYNIGKVSSSFGGVYSKYRVPELIAGRADKGLEFHTFYHPFSNQFVTNLNQDGIEGLMDSDTSIASDEGSVFTSKFQPNFSNGFVQKPSDFSTRTYFKENVCFDVYGANSLYNWELFFHAPLYIANRLSKNGRYEEAMKWFHYIFDPTTDAMPGAGETEISRYWKVLPFKTTPAESLQDYFMQLDPNTNPGAEDPVIGEWRDNPFDPHLVAQNRPIAYMKNVVLKYVENLLDWGDSLFRQFTRESVNESLQLYVMANHILGPRPEFVPTRGEIKAECYNTLKDKLDDFSNALVQLENIFPFSSEIPTGSTSTGTNLLGVGESLYFCIPDNDKLLENWDRAADRLYKIRNCMDIDGVERKLALFAPPIDPGAIVQAMSQGLSLGSILADLSSPPPIYRFTYLIQKANEFCAEIKSLGSALLSVLEKKDAEELAGMRATHERSMLELMTAVKERQLLDAKANRENLSKSRQTAMYRLNHYNSLLGNEDLTIPDEPSLPGTLNADTALPADTTINEIVPGTDTSLVDTDEAGVKVITREKEEIDKMRTSHVWQVVSSSTDLGASVAHVIPTVSADGKPFGVGAGASWGGTQLGNAINTVAKVFQLIASQYTYEAQMASKMSGYIRREQEWAFNANLAAKEIIQIDKQITAADIRVDLAQKELDNHHTAIDNASQVELFILNKFTNEELFQWMKEQLFAVYKQSYNMAYDMAKKAEKAYKYETGNEMSSFIQYGYWDNSKQGLLGGEKLQMALRQLEKSFLETNKRELELRKNISLALLNPLALQQLRQTGKCTVSLPEEMFDMDFQGHYFRRIKSMGITLPCIAGPLTTISCMLRLVKNSIRINTTMNEEGNYEHMNDEGVWIDDDRFRSSNVPVQSIASSSGQSDPGLFELNFRDERYLPFEGAGAISDWKIELTTDEDLRQFDYSTISDVILHMSYTAREDAGLFKEKSVDYIKSYLANAADLDTQPLMRMFSLRHEFPTEWYKFLNPAIPGSDQVMGLTLKKEHFPFFTRQRTIDVMKLEILAKTNRTGDYHLLISITDTDDTVVNSTQISMPENVTYANMQKATLTGTTANISVEDINVFGPMTFKLKHNSDVNYHSLDTDPEELEDLFVVINYKLSDA